MLLISGRGVKYWPAPDFFSPALRSSRPSYRSPSPSSLALNQSPTLAALADDEFFLAGSGMAEVFYARWFDRFLPGDGSVTLGSSWLMP